MILAPHVEQGFLGEHLARLDQLSFAGENGPCHDQSRSPRPAPRQTASHEQLICPDLGYARTSSTPALSTRSAFSTVSTMCGALRRASPYCFSRLSGSWEASGR